MFYFIDLEFINHSTLSSIAHYQRLHIVNCTTINSITLWTIQPYWLHYQQLFQHLFFINFFIDYSTIDTLSTFPHYGLFHIINFFTLSTSPHNGLPHNIDFPTLSTSPHYRLPYIIDFPTLSTSPHYRRLHIRHFYKLFHIIDFPTLSTTPHYRLPHIIDGPTLSTAPHYRRPHIIPGSTYQRERRGFPSWTPAPCHWGRAQSRWYLSV